MTVVQGMYDTWFPPHIASKLFGISERTLRRRVSEGKAARKRKGHKVYYMIYSQTDEHDSVISKTNEEQVMDLIDSKFRMLMESIEEEEDVIETADKQPEWPSSLCVCISDVHVGKITKDFNTAVAIKRLKALGEKVRDLAVFHGVDQLDVFLVGDIVEGEDIYPTQGTHIDLSAIEQAYTAAEVLKDIFLRLRNSLGIQINVFTVPGNHGRAGRAVNEATNWDNACYKMLALGLNNVPKITMYTNMEEFYTVQVLDKRITLNHKGIKNTSSAAQLDKVTTWFHLNESSILVHGHWHSPNIKIVRDSLIISNGSLVGLDDYAERLGYYEPARQFAFVVEEGKEVEVFHSISCEEVIDPYSPMEAGKLGDSWKTKQEMCKLWDLSRSTFYRRVQEGRFIKKREGTKSYYRRVK